MISTFYWFGFFQLELIYLSLNFLTGQSAYFWVRLGSLYRLTNANNILNEQNFLPTNKRKCFRIVGSGNGRWRRRRTEILFRHLRRSRRPLRGSDSLPRRACWSFAKTWWLRERALRSTEGLVDRSLLPFQNKNKNKKIDKNVYCSKIVNLFWWNVEKIGISLKAIELSRKRRYRKF